MARELFVYWKVGSQQAKAAHSAAAELLQALRKAHPELQARLMRRADEAGGMTTLMEIYSASAPGVTPALQAAIETQALATFAALGHPARHVEAFESLDG